MTELSAKFLDVDPSRPTENPLWPPVVITKSQIEAEAERLLALEVDDPIERQTRIVHPMACGRGLGLAPGIEVRLSALRPGERAKPTRHNATEVGFCIRGAGAAELGSKHFGFEPHDVWNVPSWTSARYANPSREPHVRLTYSNAALLRLLNVHLVEDKKTTGIFAAEPARAEEASTAARAQIEDLFELPGEDVWLMTYERLINPPAVQSLAHHWRWRKVKAELDKLTALGAAYRGRRLYLLYNPVTGRTNGTTPSFFATMTVRPPSIIDRPHRHASAAVNYYFSGSGYSRVAGGHYEWAAGDLMLSAPGWAIHNHASHDDGPVYELTVQDQPFHIWQESLLWQESLAKPPSLLGAQAGFETNRAELTA
ncbi:MAG TPA: AraC family ligand binding domain-containing protein [Caulobacteraceae bacterium]|nr:AraC family ligand binding domain-containing protein [Caulobacteraceae bacterium]